MISFVWTVLAVVLNVGGAALAATSDPVQCAQKLLGADVSVKQSQELAAKWMATKGKNIQETLTNPWMNKNVERRHAEVWEVKGIPEHAKLVKTDGLVFRHYTTKEYIESVMKMKALVSSYLPYVEAAPGVYKKNWNDVTGVFLTTPKTSRQTVGVDSHGEVYHYVDVKVASDIPVIELEPGHIYVVPLNANYRAWVREVYQRYKAGDADLSKSSLDMAKGIELRGGIDPYVGIIPIEIVGSGRVD